MPTMAIWCGCVKTKKENNNNKKMIVRGDCFDVCGHIWTSVSELNSYLSLGTVNDIPFDVAFFLVLLFSQILFSI